MNTRVSLIWRRIVLALIGLLLLVACRDAQVPEPTSVPEAVATAAEAEPPTVPAATATTAPADTPEAEAPTAAAVETEPTEAAEPVATATTPVEAVSTESDDDVLVSDDFTDSSSGWPGTQRFDNYYFGYHEPEWYHVEVQAPNEHVIVPLPEHTFDDASIDANVFVETSLSEQEGDFRYGIALRRSGRQFYAFTIDPTNGTWAVLKSSPTSLDTLLDGTNESIQGFDVADRLRVDAIGSSFTFYINGTAVAQVHDEEYASGEIGFFVQTFDMQRVHVHYDDLQVRIPRHEDVILSDDFTDSSSGWPGTQRFDAYYFGYHEPEWYHVEVHTPNEHVLVPLPEHSFGNVSIEADLFVETSLSEREGDFRYGVALRRSGRQFYAFTVDPNTGAWAVLKSSPTSLEALLEGANETLQGFDVADRLRVDAIGSNFTFSINGNAVAQVHDEEYSSGEIGFFVQTFDNQRVHVHYDALTIREVAAPPQVCTVLSSALNLRPGPGIEFTPIVRSLPSGTRVIPLTQSAFLPWIQVEVEGTGETGWIYANEPYASCNFDPSDLPMP